MTKITSNEVFSSSPQGLGVDVLRCLDCHGKKGFRAQTVDVNADMIIFFTQHSFASWLLSSLRGYWCVFISRLSLVHATFHTQRRQRVARHLRRMKNVSALLIYVGFKLNTKKIRRSGSIWERRGKTVRCSVGPPWNLALVAAVRALDCVYIFGLGLGLGLGLG